MTRPAWISAVPDEPDQVPRLVRFRADHPHVAILLRGREPTAYIGNAKICSPTLRGLLDELEELLGDPGG